MSTPSNFFALKTILVIPSIKRNLLSILQFCHDNNSHFEFDSFDFFVKDLETRKELLRCHSSETSLYPISSRVASVGNKQRSIFVASGFSENIWHRQLGHPSLIALSKFIKENKVVSDSHSEIKLSVCHACNIEKHVKLSFDDSKSKSIFSLQLVHSDVWQAHVHSVFRYKYYVIFMNDYS